MKPKLPALDSNQRCLAVFAAGVAAILAGVACYDWRVALILTGFVALAAALLCYEEPKA